MQAWTEIEGWLIRHDTTIELTAVWVLVVAFATLMLVNVLSWWAIRDQIDRTNVGRMLRRKKLAEAVMAAGMATLYALTLWGYYEQHEFGPWEKLVVRAAVVAGVLGAAVWGIRFVVALRAERRAGLEP